MLDKSAFCQRDRDVVVVVSLVEQHYSHQEQDWQIDGDRVAWVNKFQEIQRSGSLPNWYLTMTSQIDTELR
jgi:predicted restriction endonuclease